MIITSIETLTKTRCRITFDENLQWVLTASDIRDLGYCEGMEITDEAYEAAYEEYVVRRAKHRAMALLERSDYTERELEQRLLCRDGFPRQAVEEALAYVRSYRYVDDQRYAKNYVTYKTSKKSRQMIYQTLMAKGVDADTIEACMADAHIDDSESLRALYRQKFGDIHDMSPEKKQKIFNYFLRRGFKYSDIADVVKDFDSI